MVPFEPPVSSDGFLLSPAMRSEHLKGNRCVMCSKGCKPNRHHLYWPYFKKNKKNPSRTVYVRGESFEALDYSGDELYQLFREDSFNITRTGICRAWHQSLHNFQRPPTELPDRGQVQSFLDQAKFFRKLIVFTRGLSEIRDTVSSRGVVTSEQESHMERELNQAKRLLGNFPEDHEIVIPSEGYWCAGFGGDDRPEVFRPDNLRRMLTSRIAFNTALLG